MSQLDHMDCGGCLHNIKDCEFCLVFNLQNKTKKNFNEKKKGKIKN